MEEIPHNGNPSRMHGNLPSNSYPSVQPNDDQQGLNPIEILLMLSRHKWKILVLGLLGLVASAIVYQFHGDKYQSSAKLLVRYVLERSAIDSEIDSNVHRAGTREGGNVIHDEIQILKSWDLAKDVAKQIGPERLLGERGTDLVTEVTPESVAGIVSGNLQIMSEKSSHVITLSYQHKEKELVVPVLNEIVDQYFDKHIEIHRSVGNTDFVSAQTEDVRIRLEELETTLNRLKSEAGIGAVALTDTEPGETDSETGGSDWWTGPPAAWERIRESLLVAETERAAQVARISAFREILEKSPEEGLATDENLPSQSVITAYENLTARLGALRERDTNLRAKFPPGNRLVVANEKLIRPLESQRLAMEADHPVLVSLLSGEYQLQQQEEQEEQEQAIDIDAEYATLAATEATIEVLQARVAQIEKAEEKLPDLLSRIRELERLKDVEEEKYHYFTSVVEKSKIDGLLDPSRMPNINVVQTASPPIKVLDSVKKALLFGFAAGGFGLGIVIALALELFFDRRIKRPSEFKKNYMPLMISIPFLPQRHKTRLTNPLLEAGAGDEEATESDKLLLTSQEDKFWPYAAAIRDRLFTLFRLKGQLHSPKLIALTSFTKGAGTSTLASGLAAMSVANGEKVLLIDMNAKADEAHSIFEAERLLRGGDFHDVDPSGRGGAITPKNLYNLIPLLNDSDYTYVIFDMPRMTPTSPTYAMAGFMDVMLLIVDATKTDRDVVKQGCEDMLRVNPNVSCVFNKARITKSTQDEVAIESRSQLMIGAEGLAR